MKRTIAGIMLMFLGVTGALKAAEVAVLFVGDDVPFEREKLFGPVAEALRGEGITMTYSSDPAALETAALSQYAVVVIAADGLAFEGAQDRDLKKFVSSGGGLVLLGGAGDCFFKEATYTSLVGAAFASFNGKPVDYEVENTDTAHAVTAGIESFLARGGRIGHESLEKNCVVLQTRDKEPWTWARQDGKGRVVYTAFTKDEKTWRAPEFRTLLRNAIQWAAKKTGVAFRG